MQRACRAIMDAFVLDSKAKDLILTMDAVQNLEKPLRKENR
jgi:hypothetical protein